MVAKQKRKTLRKAVRVSTISFHSVCVIAQDTTLVISHVRLGLFVLTVFFIYVNTNQTENFRNVDALKIHDKLM